MKRTNLLVLLAWLTCVLVFRLATASVTAQQTTGPSPSFGTATLPPALASVRGAVIYRERTIPNRQGAPTGNIVPKVQPGDATRTDAPTAVPALASTRSPFNLAIMNDGRLAHFSR